MTDTARFLVYFDCPDCGVSFTKRMACPGVADCPSCAEADIPDVGYEALPSEEVATR